MHLDGVNTHKKGVGALMILLQPYVVRQFYLLQIPVIVVQDLARSHYRTCGHATNPEAECYIGVIAPGCDNVDTGAKIQLNHAVLAFFRTLVR